MTANKDGDSQKRRIGIFGGTFNPVHKAHVSVANEFVKRIGLDLLWVIPNRIAPLKEEQGVSGEHRLNMLKTAFKGNSKVFVSDLELKREGMSYTFDTVAELKEIYPNDELFLLVGDDWVEGFANWRNYRYILENVTLVVAKRSGGNAEALKKLGLECKKEPITLDNKMIKLSSGELRKRLDKDMLPDGVFEYIKEKGLYGI